MNVLTLKIDKMARINKRYRKRYIYRTFVRVENNNTGYSQLYYYTKNGDIKNLSYSRFKEGMAKASSYRTTRQFKSKETIIKYRLKFLIE